MIQQAEKLVAAGYQEIVLTGIHTGGYGEDLEEYDLARLLRDLDQVEGLSRVRISSIEASQISEGVLEVLNHLKRCADTCIFHSKREVIQSSVP